MASESALLRFGGIQRLYGTAGLDRFLNAHTAVIGIGGVGSWAAEALARSGVGEITLIDLDDICVTNVNRQIHALTDTIGQSKVEVMKARLLAINPECRVHCIEDYIDSDNLRELITPKFDVIIDAIDNVKAKAALIAHCKRNKIPLVCTGAAGGQTDPLSVTVSDLNKTYNDPLASTTRSLLRRHYGFSRNTSRNYGVPCVYSTQQLSYPQPDGSVCTQKNLDNGGAKLDCSGGFGAATMVTATFGFAAVSKALERLLKTV